MTEVLEGDEQSLYRVLPATVAVEPERPPWQHARVAEMVGELIAAEADKVVIPWVVWPSAAHYRAELRARLAARRWQVETGGGVSVDGVEGTFHSDRDAQFNVLAAHARGYAGGWKTQQGAFVTLTTEQVGALATALHAHKAACFAREAQLLALIAGTVDADLGGLREKIDAFWP